MPVEGEKDIYKKGGIKLKRLLESIALVFFFSSILILILMKFKTKKVVFKQNEDHLSAAPLVQEVTAPTVDLHLFDWVQILTPDSLHGATFTITWACDAL